MIRIAGRKILVSEKLIRQASVLPLFKARPLVSSRIPTPTNQQALSDVQFAPVLMTDAVIV